MKLPTLHPLIAWLIGFTIAIAVCYWPGGLALFVVAIWGGFSPSVSVVTKVLVVAVTLTVILAAVFVEITVTLHSIIFLSTSRGVSNTAQ